MVGESPGYPKAGRRYESRRRAEVERIVELKSNGQGSFHACCRVEKLFTFTLTGSKTGADGQGRSNERFISKSGRVVIETNVWNVTYAMNLAGIKTVPDKFTVKWRVEPHFVDELSFVGAPDSALENVVPLAQGLPNKKHNLEITSD